MWLLQFAGQDMAQVYEAWLQLATISESVGFVIQLIWNEK